MELGQKPYISARDAARQAGLSRDYLSKLAKEGKITGHHLGNIWFLDREAVKSFVDEKERSRAERRAQLSQMRVDEYRALTRTLKEMCHTTPARRHFHVSVTVNSETPPTV